MSWRVVSRLKSGIPSNSLIAVIGFGETKVIYRKKSEFCHVNIQQKRQLDPLDHKTLLQVNITEYVD